MHSRQWEAKIRYYMSTTVNLLTPSYKHDNLIVFEHIFNRRNAIYLFLLFSILVHAVSMLRLDGLQQSQTPAQSPISHSIEVVLNRITPETVPQQEMKPVRKKPLKRPRPEKKIVAKQNKAEPVKKVEPIPVTEPELVEEDTPEPEEAMAQAQPQNQPISQAVLTSEKTRYLQTITAHLEKHKFYPRTARRRHIEGDVRVSFNLLSNGNIENLEILSGHSSLQKATSKSIYSALPMPPRPDSLMALNTMKIEYSMSYRLHN